MSLWPASFGGRTQKSPGQASRVRTASLEMELDHDSGALRGRVLAGRHQGAALDDLDVPTLITLISEIDEDSIPYSPHILTGGSPAGVNTRQVMPRRPTAVAHRAGAK
jgi:hypothetical protein